MALKPAKAEQPKEVKGMGFEATLLKHRKKMIGQQISDENADAEADVAGVGVVEEDELVVDPNTPDASIADQEGVTRRMRADQRVARGLPRVVGMRPPR